MKRQQVSLLKRGTLRTRLASFASRADRPTRLRLASFWPTMIFFH